MIKLIYIFLLLFTINSLAQTTKIVGGVTNPASVGGVSNANISSVMGITFTKSSVASETGEIFADDFSDGDISDWTQGVGTSNTITLEDSGSFYCVKFHYDSTSNYLAFWQTLTTDADSMFLRFEVFIPSTFETDKYNGGTYQVNELFTFTTAAGDSAASPIAKYRLKGGTPAPSTIDRLNIRMIVGGEDDSPGGTYNAYDDKWTRFECGYIKGTGANGWAQILLDGNDIGTAYTTADHSTVTIDEIIFGNYYEGNIPTGDMWIRYVRIDSTGYPGAYE